MRNITIGIAAIVLTGCASMSEWRTLRIDGSSESALRESVAVVEQELPRDYHRRMFALALADIARTEAQNAGTTDDGYLADEDLRAQLDGLTYDALIALADRSGPPISRQYYSGRAALGASSRYGDLPGPRPSFNENGKPAFNTWTTGWPDRGLSGGSTVVTRPDSR